MIPKIIHYCWFGRNPKPKLADKCIKSWKKYCKDFQIIEWNEDNFDISACPLYVRQAYAEKKWAFVTDYVRLKVVYENGGVYFDTDVELRKKLGSLLEYKSFFGFEDGCFVNTGLGFGAEKSFPLLAEIMSDYNEIPFVKEDETFDTTACPRRNTPVFVRHGLQQNNTLQILDDGTLILPTDYLCPVDYQTGEANYTKNTYSVHWFSASWQTQEQKKKHMDEIKRLKRMKRKDYVIHIPNRVAKKLLGEKNYEKVKLRFKKDREQ